jgi:hypothetical protein
MDDDDSRDGPARPATSALAVIRNLVQPWSSGWYVTDWKERAATIGHLSQRFGLLVQEDGHWSPCSPAAGHPLSLTPGRSTMHQAGEYTGLSLNFDFEQLHGSEHQILAEAAERLGSAEKIVISATARALHDLDNPPELLVDLLNLLYEEALHLDAIGRLLGTDHSAEDWIPEDRATNWALVQECKAPLDYMVIEHCLYEGRGTVASAAGALHLEAAGLSAPPVAVMDAIARQEAAHNISGFRWLKLLDTGSEDDELHLADLVRRFVEAEPLPAADGTPRSLRKHFPLYLMHRYRVTGSFYTVKHDIVAASRAARRTALPGVRADVIYSASDAVLAWCTNS